MHPLAVYAAHGSLSIANERSATPPVDRPGPNPRTAPWSALAAALRRLAGTAPRRVTSGKRADMPAWI